MAKNTQKMVSSVLRDARRIVVKVGSSLVTNEGRGLDEAAIGEWSRQLAVLGCGDGLILAPNCRLEYGNIGFLRSSDAAGDGK